MTKKTFEIRYYSRGGHTRAIAGAIAEELGCEMYSTAERLNGYTDTLFLGGAIYGGRLDPNITGFIEHFDRNKVGKIILFGTAAISNPCKKMRGLLADRGIPVETDEFYCKGGFKRIYKNHPNDQDIENARAFARKWLTEDPANPSPASTDNKYANVKHWADRK